jgi:hypothetical protein
VTAGKVTGTGRVVVFKQGYGFICPRGSRSNDQNIYFKQNALEGSSVRIGDFVEYTMSGLAIKNAKELTGRDRPHAVKVAVISDDREITTTGGNGFD